MTPVALAYLKHFLFDQSLRKYFIVNYKKYHLKDNPESIEQYLMNANIGTVFLKAFFFFTSGTPSYDYWKDVNDKWLKYWEINKSNVYNTNWMFLKGSFAILRQNWDDYSDKPKIESFADTYKRLNVVSPYSGSEESDKDAQTLQEEVENKEKATNDVLEGFTFEERASRRNRGNKIADDKITVSTAHGGYRVTFSVSLSSQVIKSGYKYVRIATKADSKEIAFVFGENGVNLAGFNSKGKSNINLNSKNTVNMIKNFYGVSHIDFFELKVKNITNTSNNLIMIFSYEH